MSQTGPDDGSTSNGAAIEARNLAYAYDDRPAIADVSLSIGSGEVVALVGANGAGKTTLLRLIAGLAEPDGGTIERSGVVGFAPEDPKAALFAETVADEVAFFPRNRGLDAGLRAERAMEAMDVLDLRDRAPHALSTGEQRRVAVAAVLAGDPALVALDEPTAGLDRPGERRLGELLTGLDAAVVFSTHESDFAYEVADRVVVLADGGIRRTGTPMDVLADEQLLADADVRLPGVVTWAMEQGYDRLPTSLDDAVAMARWEP